MSSPKGWAEDMGHRTLYVIIDDRSEERRGAMVWSWEQMGVIHAVQGGIKSFLTK